MANSSNFIDTGFGEHARDYHAVDRPTGEANFQMHGIHMGIVADDIDDASMGRVHVYIPGVSAYNPNISYARVTDTRDPPGADGKPGKIRPEKRRGFILAHPMSPHFGSDKTREAKQQDGREPQAGESNSYGFQSQPRNGDTMLIAFAGGDPANCFYLGCIPKTAENDMVPGHKPAQTNASGAGYSTPVGPMVQKSPDRNEIKPSKVLHDNLTDSGLIHDPVRGLGSSSATRESPSRVSGWKTAGDPDTNMQGHQFVMDDHPDHQLMRLRTSKGTQMLLSDTGDFIYMNTGNGKFWMEGDGAGNMHVYAGSSVNFHAKEDFNFTCDRDFNLQVGGHVNWAFKGDTRIRMNGGGNMTIGEGSEDFDITSMKNMNIKVQGEIKMSAEKGITMKSADFITVQSAKDMNFKSAKKINNQSGEDFNLKSAKAVNMKAAGGDYNMDTSSNINATKGSLSVSDINDGQNANQADIPITHSVTGPPQTSGPPKSPASMQKTASAIVPMPEPWPGHRHDNPGHNAAINPSSIPKLA